MVSSTQILGCLSPAIRRHGLAATVVVSLVLSLGSLAGCGQRGPLYMPIIPKDLNAAPAPVVVPLLPASAAK